MERTIYFSLISFLETAQMFVKTKTSQKKKKADTWDGQFQHRVKVWQTTENRVLQWEVAGNLNYKHYYLQVQYMCTFCIIYVAIFVFVYLQCVCVNTYAEQEDMNVTTFKNPYDHLLIIIALPSP